jgi:hypothetical protein
MIIVNDIVLDVYPNTIIAQTIKANEVGDVKTRNVSYTNSFKIPLTENNNRVFEYANQIQSETGIPYTQIPVRQIENGIEIIRNGYLQMTQADNSYNIFILSSGYGFFNQIEGKYLVDLDLSTLIADFDPDAAMNTTTGVIFPVINYGDFDGSAMDAATNLPSTYYHTIINQIFEDAGYEKSGAIFSNAKYLNLIIPYGRKNFLYDGKFSIPFEFSAITSGSQVFVDPVFNDNIVFVNETKESIYYNSGTGRFTNSNAVTIYGDWFATLTYTFSGVFGFTVQIRKNGSTILATDNGTVAGGTIVLDSRVLFPDGVNMQQTEYIEVMFTTTTGTVTITSGNFYNSVRSNIAVVPGNAIDYGKLLPDVTQKEIITDFAVRFGLILEEKDGNVYCKSLDEIILDKANALDWTNKNVTRKDSISFTPLDYAQNNYFDYSNTDELIDKVFGRGNLAVSNANSQLDKSIFQSVFNNTATILVGTVLTAKIPIYDTSTSRDIFDDEPGIRLLLVRDKYSYEPTINGETSYKVAYFEDPNQTYTMAFNQFIEDAYYYFGLSLQKAKVPSREYLLTDIDISEFSFLYPVFDKDSYFLVNTIKNYVSGKITGVELFKIV